MTLPLVIIGSGLAGYMLAKEWRKSDTQSPLIIVTADEGDFYSKPLLSTALSQQKTPEQLVVNSAEIMSQELQAKILCHTVVSSIDPLNNIIHHSQGSCAYSQLVLACGAQVNSPCLSGDAAFDVPSVNSLSDYRRFRQWLAGKKHIVLLGAGLVACEFANDLVNAGYQVSVVAPDAYPLSAVLPSAVGEILQKFLAQAGVNWRLGKKAVAVTRQSPGVRLILEDNQQLHADGVFSAIGLRGQVDLARSAGILVNRGIRVNRWLQTNFSNIYALGDCAEVDGQMQMYVAPLLQSARALAKILTGGNEPVHYPAMPVVLKTPVLPLVFSPPPSGVIGEWRLEGEGHHLRALYHDLNGQLRGFVLAGDKIRDKLSLAKQLPLVFNG
jgi:rubredoxin-NAD+ reductase